MRAVLVTAGLLAVLFSSGCKGCKQGKSASVQPSGTTSAATAASSAPGGPSKPEAGGPDPVHGLWSQRPFLARSALVHVHEHWVTVTLIDREAKCDSARLTANDMGVQFTIPSGPDNDFFAERDFPVELRLHGAGGISRIPAGHVTARIGKLDPENDQTLEGTLRFRFRTGAKPDAPAYASEGSFTATVCDNRATKPSVAEMKTDQTPIAGEVAKRKVKLHTVLAYTRDDGYGGTILMLKAYELDVPCHTKRSATPYLFGAELGPGPGGKYFVGKPIPTDWIMQMRTDAYSERSVHAAHGASWLQLDSVKLRPGARSADDSLPTTLTRMRPTASTWPGNSKPTSAA